MASPVLTALALGLIHRNALIAFAALRVEAITIFICMPTIKPPSVSTPVKRPPNRYTIKCRRNPGSRKMKWRDEICT